VLQAEPAGFATDLDGTLSPIVPNPSAARPVPGAGEALEALASQLAVVAVVTGRAALDARRILGGAGSDVLVIGNHGLEWLEPGADAPDFDEGLAELRSTLAEVVARIPASPGVEVEDKGLSATIHYRGAPDPDAARVELLTALQGVVSASFEIREGRRSIELRPAGRGDKGSAVRALVERFRLRGLVVAGDDATDLDMFAAARDLEAAGLRTAVLGVSGGREVPAEVAGSVDVLLPDPDAFVQLLGRLAAIR
jgi:trehalose 6-phosphate phosphatase